MEGATLVATVAMDADASQPAEMGKALADEAREVFQRRGAQRLDLVEKLVVERQQHVFDRKLEEAEIDHHADHKIRRAAQAHLDAEGMAVNLFAGCAKRRT